jgi:hypothetical protein
VNINDMVLCIESYPTRLTQGYVYQITGKQLTMLKVNGGFYGWYHQSRFIPLQEFLNRRIK